MLKFGIVSWQNGKMRIITMKLDCSPMYNATTNYGTSKSDMRDVIIYGSVNHFPTDIESLLDRSQTRLSIHGIDTER